MVLQPATRRLKIHLNHVISAPRDHLPEVEVTGIILSGQAGLCAGRLLGMLTQEEKDCSAHDVGEKRGYVAQGKNRKRSGQIYNDREHMGGLVTN